MLDSNAHGGGVGRRCFWGSIRVRVESVERSLGAGRLLCLLLVLLCLLAVRSTDRDFDTLHSASDLHEDAGRRE